jgi:hypothetical protein
MELGAEFDVESSWVKRRASGVVQGPYRSWKKFEIQRSGVFMVGTVYSGKRRKPER